MAATNAYATDKLQAHPDVLRQLRETGQGKLISVHLMPQNSCHQNCSFCSYRMPDHHNSEAFDVRKHIPWQAMTELLDDFEDMGVKGIEVTGGGEPLIYPYTSRLWVELARRKFATAIVTNGVAMNDRAPLLTQCMKWARVSIDAANKETYARMRRCSDKQFDLAWRAVRELRVHAPNDPEFRLGVGFTLANENIREVYDFVRRANDNGADNVRLSVTFSDRHLDYFDDRDAVVRAVADSVRAVEDFSSPSFRVHNLIPRRVWEIQHPYQDYRRCPSKDLLCVVEGECRVYTCCTFAGSLSGCYGKFTEHPGGFKGMWMENADWRLKFNASEYCHLKCLYRDRNLAMNALIDSEQEPVFSDRLHREFI